MDYRDNPQTPQLAAKGWGILLQPVLGRITPAVTRYTQPDRDQLLLLQRLKLTLPPQPPPRITTTAENPNPPAATL